MSENHITLSDVEVGSEINITEGQSVTILSVIKGFGRNVRLDRPETISREDDRYIGLSSDDGGTGCHGDGVFCTGFISDCCLLVGSSMRENCPLKPGQARVDEFYIEGPIPLTHLEHFIKFSVYADCQSIMFEGDLYHVETGFTTRMRTVRDDTGNIIGTLCHSFTGMSRPGGNHWEMRREQIDEFHYFLLDEIERYNHRLDMLRKLVVYKVSKIRTSKVFGLVDHAMFEGFINWLGYDFASELYETLVAEEI